MLNNASFPTKENLLYNAFAAPRADYGRQNQPANLFFAVTAPNLNQAQIVEYPRYWHGYLVVLKPLLSFFDITQIRLLNFLTQTLLLIIVCYLTAKRLNKKYFLAFITAVFFLNPISLSKTLQYTAPYDIMLITIIAILKKDTPPTYKTFLLTGISTAFFDLLSAPLLTLGFPLIFVINLYHTNLKSGLNRIISFSTAWATGYLGFWFSKWVLSSLILHKNIIKEAFDTIIYRTVGNGYNETGISGYTALNAYSRNLAELKPELFMVIILLFSIIMLLSCLITKSVFIKNTQTLLTLIIGAYPFLWYAVVTNHSVIHPLMSYRLLAVTVFALTAALASAIKKPPLKHSAQLTKKTLPNPKSALYKNKRNHES